MTNSASSTDFLWVNSTISQPPDDIGSRVKNRQQVMKNVAVIRKRNGKQWNRNLRQYPLFESDAFLKLSQDLRLSGTPNGAHTQRWLDEIKPQTAGDGTQVILSTAAFANSLSTSNFLSSYVDTDIKYTLDPQGLCFPTSVEVDLATGILLSESPCKVFLLLGRKHQPYFSYLSSRYGDSGCLTDAIDCLVARIRCLDSSSNSIPDSSAIISYAKALRSLQAALDSPVQPVTSDILCATEILTVYELLNPTSENAWTEHTAGSACLIHQRGPTTYNTDLEKNLFMSHVGSMVTQSILRNETCFLEQSAWKQVLQSMIIDDQSIPERGKMVISLIAHVASIPRLFRDITKALCHHTDIEVSKITELRCRAHELCSSLQRWRLKYYDSNMQPIPGCPQVDGFCNILVHFYFSSIISNRLLTAIFWAGWCKMRHIEEASQEYAHALLALAMQREKAYLNLQGGLLMAPKIRVANATIATRRDWQIEILDGSSLKVQQPGVIQAWKFERWCRSFGRKIS